jgi:hypothetical protein
MAALLAYVFFILSMGWAFLQMMRPSMSMLLLAAYHLC